MQLTFLGTGTSTGIPEIGCSCATCLSPDPRDKRLRASVLLSIEGHHYLIDCGPDFRYQMLRTGIHTLNAIFLTHEHYDHVGGIDDIRPLFREARACPIYAEPNVITALRTRMPYAFTEHRYPGVPDIELRPLTVGEGVPLRPTPHTLVPLRVMHGRLPIVGFRMGDLAYITDCKSLPPDTLAALQGVRTLVINALRTYPHPAHIALDEALEIVSLIAPERTYLTHFAHTFGTHSHIETLLPPGVFPAYDGLSLET